MVNIQSNIPEEVIYTNKFLVFNVIADKPLTVGANAAVAISFPQGKMPFRALPKFIVLSTWRLIY